MSKGSNRRPTDEAAYADSYERIFGRKDMGCSSMAEQGALTASVAGSSPAAPAIYIDDASG